MKQVTINLAQGLDRSVDPRVAPNGTLSRVQNMRLDINGRMVLRNGYQSLGTTVQGGGTQLVPFDLKEFNGNLVCLGNHSPANQTGIRAPYIYDPYTPSGSWRTSVASAPNTPAPLDNTSSFISMPAADAPRIVYSDLHSNVAATSRTVSDCAVIGNFACNVVAHVAATVQVRAEIVDLTTGVTIHEALFDIALGVRVIACGNTFVLFRMNSAATAILAHTFDVTSSTTFSVSTNIAVGLTAFAPFDVNPNDGASTEYLIVYSTVTGYTWERRIVSTHAIQSSANVVTTANAAVSICGATGETVNVASLDATPNAVLRTFSLAGALLLGPTVINAVGGVTWVALSRFNASNVTLVTRYTVGTSLEILSLVTTIVTATHGLFVHAVVAAMIAVTRPAVIGGIPFVWYVSGTEPARPYVLMAFTAVIPSTALDTFAAVALLGAANPTYTVAPADTYVAHLPLVSSKLYASLVSLDPRDGRLRSNLLETPIWSGARRQMATIGSQLFVAGGLLAQYDGLVPVETGFVTGPVADPTQTTRLFAGALTLLGTYQYVFVWRGVDRNGNVTLSAPSPVTIVTLAGAENQLQFKVTKPPSVRRATVARLALTDIALDVFRTEAGGSIPRRILSLDATATNTVSVTVLDGVADTVQQTGAKVYTQGESGAISGRLPLAIPSPCRNVLESQGKLWLSGLERRTEIQLSVENRPGEAVGFVNDDLFFIENHEDVTALAAGSDGRRLIFSKTTVREVRGDGPNAAGIGDLSEAITVDSPVGCNDWRSVVRSEHGVFYRAGDGSIYLLPRGGGSALDASQGIRDILEAYPVTTGAVRHESDQLLTFTLSNTAGTDGRIVSLDLRTSGMDSRRGWVANWIVDRTVLFEDVPDIQVLSDTVQVFEGLQTSLSVTLPSYNQSGDRFVVFVGGSGTSTLQSYSAAGWSGASQVINNGAVATFDRILTGAAVTLTIVAVQAATHIVRLLHLRGCHASQAVERVFGAANNVVTLDLAALTPSWGSAKNLWISACCASGTFFPVPPAIAVAPLFTAFPSGFGNTRTDAVHVTGLLGNELATCRQVLTAASLDPSAYNVSASTELAGVLIAIRPAGTAGTPVRAPEQFQGRLVVCNSSDVLQNTFGSFADQGNLFIQPEIETATIYGSGVGGAAMHRGIVFVGEFRQRCVLGCELSYDDGLSYTELAAFTLNANQYTAGQTVRLKWVPRRRKVEGVRARFRVTEDAGTGPSEGLVFQQAIFEFEELIGSSRLPALQRK